MKLNLIFFYCILAVSISFAQTAPSSVSFKTPEVAAFNHFIEAPVSMYTGVPSISIPIYELNIKGVNVPIKLDYHAGGIRVDQDATWVGLGWSLSYGGEISRKTRGIPDEFYYFYGGTDAGSSVNYFMQLPNIGSNGFNMGAQNNRIEYINNAKRGGSDLMPDEFYYNALGYSGRFMFNQAQNKFIIYPKEDIEVNKFDGPLNAFGSPWKLYSWKFKLPDGVSVEFGKEGYSRQNMSVMNVPTGVTNSWQIKSIKNNYNDSITYSYDNFNYRMPKISGQQYRIASEGPSSGSTTVSDPLISDSRIRVINFPGGRVEFSTIGRQDMPNQALDEINVYDNNNNNIKKIHFNYDYFYGNAFDILGMVDSYYASRTPADYRYKRLKLTGISIVAPGLQTMNYTFDYNTLSQMPSKYSFSQDHWGYFNGIPNTSAYGFIPNLDPRFAGGDRRVKSENSRVFSLKSITYPEGGKTEFLYEGNTATTTSAPNELMATYQDDNFAEKTAAILISSYSRSTSYPDPTETLNGTRYFRKQFTVGGAGFTTSNNWDVSTDFGISYIERNSPYFVDNANFKLEKINPDNSRTLVRNFNTTDVNYPYNNAPQRNGNDNGFVNISAGNYEMTVALTYLNQPNSEPDNQHYTLRFVVNWRELNPLNNTINIGGLRIKEINYYTSENNLVKKKNYNYLKPSTNPTNANITSGRIVSFPKYIQAKEKYDVDPASGAHKMIQSLHYSSNSVLPLETTFGSFTGYEDVSEIDVDVLNPVNNQRSESHFSFVQPYFSQFYTQMNLGVYEPKEWTRGKLLSKKYFKGNDIIKKEEYEYYFVSPYANNSESAEDFVDEVNTDFISYQSFVTQYPFATDIIPEDFYDVTDVGNCQFFYYSPFNNTIYYPCYYTTNVPYFKHYTGFDKIKSKTVTSYDSPLIPVTQVENYAYQKAPVHYQLTKSTNTVSTGTEITTETKYPQDLSLSGVEESARMALVDRHQLNIPLSTALVKNSTEQVSQTAYTIDPVTNFVLPKLVRTNTGQGGAFEQRNFYNKFDNKANLLEVQQSSGLKICYLYSYNKLYPIAEIKNADFNTIESILTPASIEEFSNRISPLRVDVDAFLAPLKSSLLLKDAQITSYTYKPLVGMTSSTDAKGMTTYYEYDAFQRLKAIKDQNGNILKQTDYHYKN